MMRFRLGLALVLLGSGCKGCGDKSSPAPSGLDAAGDVASADAGATCSEAQTVPYDLDTGSGVLFGTLELPAGCAPPVVALIHAGSGPTDRDGNSTQPGVHPDSYRLLAAGLAERGIASLRYDKAGVMASAGAAPANEADYRFEMGADDAARWVKLVRADARFGRVAFAGHSEGALVAMLAAKQQKVDAYASLEGAGRPIGAVLREQLARSPADPDLLVEANAILDSLEIGQVVADVPAALVSLFRPSAQPYLISWMKYDPAREIASVDAPVLIVQGTTDIQVSITDANLLAAARADATLAIIEGMNHVFKTATLDTASQNRANADPSLPIVDPLFAALVGFFAR